ncbi:MAG TPA: ROK family protein [Acidimicrobiales bacterium]|nr:ROK family protein [Acidimicrobiales bacterium]
MNAAVAADGAPAFGVDIGGTKVLGVAVDATDAIVSEVRVATPHVSLLGPSDPGSGDMVAAVAEVVARLRRSVGWTGGSASPAVGVGVPGMCDRDGVLRFAPNLPSANGTPVRELLERALPGTPVTVENDAALAALAEHELGAARGTAHALVVTLGTGIGGGLITEGRVFAGAHGFAGEIGHMVVDPSGPLCPCGRRGCWERFASGGGLGRLAREAAHAGRLSEVVAVAGGDAEGVRGEHVTVAALAGDPGAVSVIEELGWWVALGLTNLVAILDPDRIVVGGGLVAAGEILLGPTRRAFAELVEGADHRPAVEIVLAELGDRAGAVGGALVTRRTVPGGGAPGAR